MKIIGNNYKTNEIIKIIREWSELTQKEFGKKISRSERTIQCYESGDCKMTLDKFMEIVKNENLRITIEKVNNIN